MCVKNQLGAPVHNCMNQKQVLTFIRNPALAHNNLHVPSGSLALNGIIVSTAFKHRCTSLINDGASRFLDPRLGYWTLAASGKLRTFQQLIQNAHKSITDWVSFTHFLNVSSRANCIWAKFIFLSAREAGC